VKRWSNRPPRARGAAINMEMFSCAGGMAEGFRRAGIHFDMAIDKAKDHCDSYEANLGYRPVQMDASDFLGMLRHGYRVDVNLFVADPPCTPWSRAGKRKGLEDERDMLRETAEIIGILRPRAYVIGNVPGLEDSNNLRIVQEVIGGLARFGYCVADFATLNAADYGVPQHRWRPFWFGHLHGPCIQWPEPTHGDPTQLQASLPHVAALLPWVTTGQALGHLPLKAWGRKVKLRKRGCNSSQHGSVLERPARVVGTSNLSDGNVIVAQGGRVYEYSTSCHPPSQVDKPSNVIPSSMPTNGGAMVRVSALSHPKNHPPSYIDEPAMTVRGGSGGGATRAVQLAPRRERKTVAALTLNDRHMPATLDAPSPTVAAKQSSQAGNVISLAKPYKESTQGPQSQRVYAVDRPASTIQVREDRLGSGMTIEWPDGKPKKKRKGGPRYEVGILLSPLAAAILQGFPDAWTFCGATKKAVWSQIGQAMPPALAQAVGGAVRRQMEATVHGSRPERFVPFAARPERLEVVMPEQVGLPLPVVCPSCCASLITANLAVAGERCQGCSFAAAGTVAEIGGGR